MTSHDDIRAALAAAIPGPWVVHDDGFELVVVTSEDDHWPRSYCPVARGMGQGEDEGESDAHLIANAPEWLAELLAEVDALTARAEAAEAAVQRVRDLHPLTMDEVTAAEWCYTCLLPYPCPTLRALDGGE